MGTPVAQRHIVAPHADTRPALLPQDFTPNIASHNSTERARPTWGHLVALAGLQLIIGYQLWASGVDKLLFANFPHVVGGLLAGTLQGGRLPAPFADLLRVVVLPHSALFGVFVEWGETLAGTGLIAGAVVALAVPALQARAAPAWRRWLARGRRVVEWLALGAAAGGALMGLSFYFVDGTPSQWVMPSVAFGGVLDPGFLVLVGCVVLLADAIATTLTTRPPRDQSAL